MQGILEVMDREAGHTTIAWDTDQKDGPLDPEVAKTEFDRLVQGGWLGVGTKVGAGGLAEAEQLKQFDPTFPRITLQPQPVGG